MMKKWTEMTQADIDRIKREQCITCEYLSKRKSEGIVASTCDYLLITGSRRGCSPLECKKKGIYKKKTGKRRRNEAYG
jgi:hypothetical protein